MRSEHGSGPGAVTAAGGSDGVGEGEGEDRRQEDDPQDVELDDRARREDRRDPPPCPAGGVGAPSAAESERGEERDRVGVPDERRFLDGGGGDGHQQPGDDPGDAAAHGPGEPPGHPNGRDAHRRDPGDDAVGSAPVSHATGASR